MRTCKECKSNFPDSEFYTQKHRRKNKKRGEFIVECLSTYCKVCDRAKSKKIKDSKEYKERQNIEKRRKRAELPAHRDKINTQKRENLRVNHKQRLLKNAKSRAVKKGLDFNLTEDDIILPELCPLLKVPFIPGTKGDYRFTYSLDKIDPLKGYTKDNVWVITMKANTMKSNATKEQLLIFADSIYEHFQDDIVRTIENDESIELQDKEPEG